MEKLFALLILVSVTDALFPLPPCPPIGLYGLQDPNSCRRFLACNNGKQTTVNCPEGQEFDIVVGNCNRPEVAACNRCASNPNNNLHLFLDESYCHKYVMCNGPMKTELECSSGLHFNPVIRACDLPENAKCPHTSVPPTEIPTPPTGTFPPTGPPTPPTGNPPTGTPTPPTGSPPTGPPTPPTGNPPTGTPTPPVLIEAECDLNQNFDLIASLKDCSRYLICSCGHANIQYCAPGLVYDVIHKRCDSRNNGAICLSDYPGNCDSAGGNGQHDVAHPFDRRHFYTCLNGVGVLRACPPGEQFNDQISRCELICVARNSKSVLIEMSQNSGERDIQTWW